VTALSSGTLIIKTAEATYAEEVRPLRESPSLVLDRRVVRQ